MLVDKNSGYGCGWLALLGIIGIGFMFLLVSPLIMVNHSKEKQYGEDGKLVYISANYAKAGKYNQALDTVETITEEGFKAKALQIIATELVAAGESEQALRVTRNISDDSIKSKTIQAIVPYLTTATEHEQAIQVAKTMTDYQPKTKALDAILRRLVATGNPERAVQIAQTIQSYYGGKEKAMAAIEGYKRLQ